MVVLSSVWSDWLSALAIVQPNTVIAWHRKGFRLFWTCKVRRGQPSRPVISREVRELIRRMSRENPLWGAPHIYGELLKLGIDIGEIMVRHRKPPSQTRRTFLNHHVKTLVFPRWLSGQAIDKSAAFEGLSNSDFSLKWIASEPSDQMRVASSALIGFLKKS